MKKNLILKTIGYAAMGVGVLASGIAIAARFRKAQDEAATAKVIVDADVIETPSEEESSSVRGKKRRKPVLTTVPTRSRRVRSVSSINTDIFSSSARKKMCIKRGQENSQYPTLVPCDRATASDVAV